MNLVLMKQVNQCYRFFFLVRDGSNVYDKKMRSQLLTFGAAGEKPTGWFLDLQLSTNAVHQFCCAGADRVTHRREVMAETHTARLRARCSWHL